MTFTNLLRLSSGAVLACVVCSFLSAGTVTWTGASGGDWDTDANWDSGSKPTGADTVIFNSNISSVTNSASDQTVTHIRFDSTSVGSVTIGSTTGNSITLNNGGQIAILNTVTTPSLTETINSPIILAPATATSNGAHTFTNNGSMATTRLVIGGAVSGGTTTGGITLTLTGPSAQSQGSNEVKGLISDGGAAAGLSIVKTSAGRWILSNDNNSFSGGVSVNSGTLAVTSIGMTGQNSAIGTNGTIKVGSQGSTTFLYQGAGDVSDKNFQLAGTNGLTIYSSGTGAITLGGNFTTTGAGGVNNNLQVRGSFGTTTTPNYISGVISDGNATLNVIKGDNNVWGLSGNNTYTGTTTINGGTLIIGNGGTSGTLGSGAVVINSVSATLSFNRSDTLTVTNNISGAGVLKQIGSGTLVLSGTNAYTGLTTVSDGKLVNNGSIAGAVVVDGGALGGSGTFGGLVTINSGGTLSPGNSPGVATFSAGLTLGGTTLLEIAGIDRGVSYDAVNVGGTLTYGGELEIAVSTSLAGGETFNLFNAIDGSSAPLSAGSFTSVTLSGSYSGTFTFESGVWTALGVNGINFSFDQATGALTSTAAAIPEPSTYAAILGGLAAVGVMLRRRRQS